ARRRAARARRRAGAARPDRARSMPAAATRAPDRPRSSRARTMPAPARRSGGLSRAGASPRASRKAEGGFHVAKRVLVVEDNELNLKLFCDLLRAHDFTVEPVRDGREAVATARAFDPDLAIMDIQMPHVSGI